ncbi:MAG TPA: hypothetical protein PKE30_05920 [Niabella sp.]|nr:hypothetical protein [Niabella sp.]
MQQQSQARIFLADKYQVIQTEYSRSIHVFTDRTPAFNNLAAVKDETLAAKSSTAYYFDTGAVLLPVVGTLVFRQEEKEAELNCGEIMVINSTTAISISNPYDDCLVNYIIVSFETLFDQAAMVYQYPFDLNAYKNKMLDVFSNSMLCISLGKFDMRRETTYYLSGGNKACFCLVIQGSFEIEGRLLHERDALAVWDTEEMDIESLGKESILFLIEQPVSNLPSSL